MGEIKITSLPDALTYSTRKPSPRALSRQFLVEASTWLLCAAEAGLFAEELLTFPKGEPYVRITLGRYVRRSYSVRHALPGDAARHWHDTFPRAGRLRVQQALL